MKDLIDKLDLVLGDSVTVSNSYGEERGKTTKDNGHDHDYFIKRITGDGGTSKDAGHTHKIKAMVVKPAKNHTHDLK
jgi:hypothetical protein